jgi:hypothetical protein
MRVTEDFDPRPRMSSAQRFQCRQSQNEIAKRAAANDEDAFNKREMRERLALHPRQKQKRLCHASAQ